MGEMTAVMAHPANRGRRLRSLIHLARSEAWARITDRPVRTGIGSHSQMFAHLHRGGSWRAVRANPPDFNEMSVWSRHLGEGSLFVDVGAHAGIYTLWALDLGASVVAIEPVPELVAQLQANLELNGCGAEVHQVALADQTGTMHLGGPDLLRGHLIVDEGATGLDESTAQGATEVCVRTLDEVVGDRTVDGLKIDVEGAERLVLEGGRRLLEDGRVELIQLEWNRCSLELLSETREPVAALLRSNGYELCRPDANGLLVPEPDPQIGSDVFARRSA
jgi:FkbM family methyltransferase